jgi:[protein-PII] uridylyltransferase
VTAAHSGRPSDEKPGRDVCLLATREHAQEQRAKIRARHQQGEAGANVVHELTQVADEIVCGVFQFGVWAAPSPRAVSARVALCALGGYGRGEMNPESDLDVCLVYEGPLDENIKALNSYFIPFMWDAGFKMGYSTYNVAEAMQLAEQDQQAFTGFLESRLLSGNSTVFAQLKLHVRELQHGTMADPYIATRIQERYEGLPDEYADLYDPEPNIKENAGGLRDAHSAQWLLMVAYGTSTLDEVAGQGLITPEEHLRIVEALDFIWRIRNELHFSSGVREDRLTFANQRHVATALNLEGDMAHRSAALMQEYYVAASALRNFMHIAARICRQESPQPDQSPESRSRSGIVIRNQQVYAGVGQSGWFAHHPARLMEVFWLAARNGATLNRQTERVIQQNLDLINDSFRSSELVRRFFVAICNHPLQAGSALREAASVGVLARYLPEYAAIADKICYEDFHTYPVDEHTLRAIEALALISEMEGPVGRSLQAALEHLSDPYILVLAILFHDLGKVAGEVHTEEGVVLTRQICQRIGLPEEDEERIAFLVQHHIQMTLISQYRDTDDDDTVRAFADTMKTEQRLRALFLLSYADLHAVGPGVWNDWKGALLLKLYLKTEKRLLGRAETLDEAYWQSPKAEQIRAHVFPELAKQVEEHIREMGERYFAAFNPETIALHMEAVAEAETTGLSVRCTENHETGRSEVVVCTRDRHGLFSMIAGALSSQLIDIDGAALFTRSDGMVVDSFTVADARHRRALSRAQVRNIRDVLNYVLLEDRPVEEYVEQSRRGLFALLQPRVPVPTRIAIDNKASRVQTIIDIETGDRTGLLYDIVKAMADVGLDIVSARIVTDARRVRDCFYINHENEKIQDEHFQGVIRDALRDAIHPRSALESKGGIR